MRSLSDLGVALAALCALLEAACTPPAPRQHYAVAYNGGLGGRAARCEEPALRIVASGVAAFGRDAPGCGAPGGPWTLDATAAWALVQPEASAHPIGPIVSNRVELRLVGLASGGSAHGYSSGGGATGLASGGGASGLASSGGTAGLARGGGTDTLAAGGSTAGLGAGGSEAGLDAGGSTRAIEGGGGAAALASGGGERPAIDLAKSVSADHAGERTEARFGLVLTNDSSQTLVRIVLVDRIDPLLEVRDAEGARVYPLDDGSTLLVWDVHERVPPGGRRAWTIRFRVRPRTE